MGLNLGKLKKLWNKGCDGMMVGHSHKSRVGVHRRAMEWNCDVMDKRHQNFWRNLCVTEFGKTEETMEQRL